VGVACWLKLEPQPEGVKPMGLAPCCAARQVAPFPHRDFL
jgi:hypothetical protein